MRYPHRRRGRGRKGIAFGSGSPITGYVNPIPGSRRAFGAINDAHYADIPTYVAQLAGEPAYELFVSTILETQTKVDNWRAAFPGSVVLGYLILFNLEAEPAPGSLYYDLVNAPGFPDLWVRKGTDNSKILLSGFFGYYLWTTRAIEDYLIPWMQQSGTLYDWFTKFDGFFLDNLPWELGSGAWDNILTKGGGSVNVDGANYNSVGSLEDLYVVLTADLTNKIKLVDPTRIVIRNAAAYDGVTAIQLLDENANGLLWEPVDNTPEIYDNASWDTPKYGMQFVNTAVEWAEIQELTYPAGQIFFQNSTMPGRI